MSESGITQRAQHLLKILVQRYIRDGQPVGSKTLAADNELALSSATIRNVMADLEACGYLTSPHTSAGRIPTNQAYRLFVDSMLTVRPVKEETVAEYQQQIKSDSDTQKLVTSVSSMLSGITSLAGIVTLPKRDIMRLRQIEFLPLSGTRVLVILVLNEKEVQNRIIQTDRQYSQAELQQAANFINQQFQGLELAQLDGEIRNSMQGDRQNMENIMQTVLDVAGKTIGDTDDESDFVMAGQDNLLELAEAGGDMQKLRGIFETFTRKRDILHLMDQAVQAQGVQIFIGEESGYDVFEQCSVVTAPYRADGQVVGVLGVVGPTRMSYGRVIPIVDVTAKLLTTALNKAN